MEVWQKEKEAVVGVGCTDIMTMLILNTHFDLDLRCFCHESKFTPQTVPADS